MPTVFGKAGEVLKKAVEQYRPDAVVCVGQAGGRAAITPEMIAVNIMDARIPDNAGNKPCHGFKNHGPTIPSTITSYPPRA